MAKFAIFAAICIALSLPSAAAGQAAPPAAPSAAPQVGLIGTGLNVADMERSLKFYVEGLGLKMLSRNERGDTVEQFLGYPAMPYPPLLELIARKPGASAAPLATPAAAPSGATFKIVLSVDNAEAIHAQLKRAGFSPPPVRMNPTAGGGVFFVKDPDGYNIEIVQRPPVRR